MYLVFYVFFFLNDLFYLFVLASIAVNQKTSTETDVMSKIEMTASPSMLQTKLVLETVERLMIKIN